MERTFKCNLLTIEILYPLLLKMRDDALSPHLRLFIDDACFERLNILEKYSGIFLDSALKQNFISFQHGIMCAYMTAIARRDYQVIDVAGETDFAYNLINENYPILKKALNEDYNELRAERENVERVILELLTNKNSAKPKRAKGAKFEGASVKLKKVKL